MKFLPCAYKGTVLLNNTTNFCVTVHGLYWHEYATPERTLFPFPRLLAARSHVTVRTRAAEESDWAERPPCTQSRSRSEITETLVLKGCKNRNSFKRIIRFYLIKDSIFYEIIITVFQFTQRATGNRSTCHAWHACRRLPMPALVHFVLTILVSERVSPVLTTKPFYSIMHAHGATGKRSHLYCTAQTECMLLTVQQIPCDTLREEYRLRVFKYWVQCTQNRK